MRRLPIYFLVDISESMVGEPIEQVQEGIADIIRDLKKIPIPWRRFIFPLSVLPEKLK